ncbi:MAG TPA: EAL domain-containing protein [Novimethylophilus sp.]|jgi:EAL domain-containing protein (putative c-di-GMP-specific phosphodiesterase class I)/DNA-binding NarL/FixJ family response regulator|uniref:EAL domain-containing protein n=1 Tax=Novimethylophilus sp. TaxID=2137426 RepID=UPI002F42D60B
MKINELNLLVVEDDDFQRQMVVNMLRSLGVASISDAGNGRQALEIIRGANSRPVDVVLCDLNMPEMDGMECLRHLGQERHNVAIIITSVLDSKLLASVGRMAKLYGIKLLGTIEKPIMLVHLKELLSKHGHSENKWDQPVDEKPFTLVEILQGIRANQFVAFFQPKADLKTGRIVGAEALARWIHPEHGVVSPYAFIPPLEQSGNIDALTFLMLEQSASACRLLLDRGYILTISVNLSLVSLGDSTLADKITQVVRNAGIDPQYIVLEITESAAMTNVAQALENLARLCMNGFALSIDDYGTGYSSMQQLTRIAFSELKIDQSFVKDFADNEALSIVVESSIDMAHKLRIKSIAEGVETQQDWDRLKSLGCDMGQGYFIAKPMDVTAFHDFMGNYSYNPTALSPLSAPDQGKINILVVEDDNFTRKLILRVLHDLGFPHITESDSAESAIKLFEANTFDLIITDVDMPGMNGLKFVQLIRAGKTLAKPQTRIVVLTAFSQTEILGAALALDINGFLVKPIIPAVVDDKLSQAISEHLHLHPPLAYEAVSTEFKNLPGPGNRPPNIHGGAAITLSNHKTHGNEGRNVRHVLLQRLRPGMILKESIHLTNGTLILSSGHTFTELSINRLNDIKALLTGNSISVQEIPEAG